MATKSRTSSDSLSQASETARKELLDAITDAVESVRNSGYSLNSHTGSLESLARSYRYLTDGEQPNTVAVKVSK